MASGMVYRRVRHWNHGSHSCGLLGQTLGFVFSCNSSSIFSNCLLNSLFVKSSSSHFFVFDDIPSIPTLKCAAILARDSVLLQYHKNYLFSTISTVYHMIPNDTIDAFTSAPPSVRPYQVQHGECDAHFLTSSVVL
jgi:hypothetical protein